jgi:hypothetical protein
LGTGLFAVPLIAMTDSPVEAGAPRDAMKKRCRRFEMLLSFWMDFVEAF